MKRTSRAVVAAFGLWLATPASAEWWTNTDDQPRQIAPGAWYFSVNVPVRPVGRLELVVAQYDFYDFNTGIGTTTDGISVDYAYDGVGVDWSDDRTFLAIAPTLFDQSDGFIEGWSAWDVVKGKFAGTVYATAPLVRVWFSVEADQLVCGKRRR